MAHTPDSLSVLYPRERVKWAELSTKDKSLLVAECLTDHPTVWPAYSLDLTSAMRLAKQFKLVLAATEEGWEVYRDIGSNDHLAEELARSESLPEAICIAVLRVNGVGVEA